IVTMPARWASWGVAKATGFPNSSISPASAPCAPDKTLSSVDLPAPFSPRSAWISDGPTSRWTFSSASTPGKRLLTPVILRIGPPDIARAGDSAAGALGIQERSLIGVLKKEDAPQTARPPALCRLLHLVEALGVLQIVFGDRDGSQQVDLLLRLLPRLQVVRHDLYAHGALLGRKLLDRRGELAVAHLSQRLGQRVEADDDDVFEVTRFERFNRAERHVVVGGIDDLGRRAHPGEQGFSDFEAVVAVEVGGLLRHDLVVGTGLVEHVVQPLVAVNRRARAG